MLNNLIEPLLQVHANSQELIPGLQAGTALVAIWVRPDLHIFGFWEKNQKTKQNDQTVIKNDKNLFYCLSLVQ